MILKQPLAILSVMILTLASTAQADSAKLINPNNGHTYQRFDAYLTWNDAKVACFISGGHLATLTSQAENNWVWTNFGLGGINIWLGGTDENLEGVWTWITGEAWNYSNWGPGQPDNYIGDQDHLLFFQLTPNQWDDHFQDWGNPYLCEWELSQYLDVTTITDINGDSVADQAVLVIKSNKYYLRTIDSATGKQLKQVALGTTKDITPIALTSVGQQISALITISTGTSILQLRNNATLALVKTLTLSK